jgi:hypothetical protein
MASRLLPGEPLGPFAYESTRADDPNDVIPHQHRRELRAMRLLTAWINHLDSRQQNSLDLWVEQGGRTYVKHYVLDWGESLGSRWPNDPLSRRLGHSYYFDPWHIAGDFLSLGFVPRPWRRARVDPEARIFGYFRAEGFVASRWKPAYPNPAFRRMTRRDALWMVRIIARFSDDHLRAIVAQARLRDRGLRAHLLGLLRARRDRILREYLTKHAPLDEIRLRWRGDERRRQQICFEHLGVALGIVKPRQVQYRLRLRAGPGLERRLSWHQAKPDPAHPARTCLPVSPSGRRPAELAPSGARDDHPLRYGVLEIHVLQGEGFHPTTVVAIHLYDLGPERGFRLVGIRRRDPRETPRQGLNRSAVNLPSWL